MMESRAKKDFKLAEGEEEVTEVILEETDGITEALLQRCHARRMGHLENYFALLQRQDLYGNFATYCEYDTELGIHQLVPILREIFFKHPILVHTIVPKKYPNHHEFYLDKEYLEKPYPEHDYIKIIPKLRLNDILLNEQGEYKEFTETVLKQFTKDNYVITEKLTEMIAKIKVPICHPTRPNWRLLVLPSDATQPYRFKHLVYISNHCSSDAMSSVNLFKDISGMLFRNRSVSINNNETMMYDYEIDGDKFSKIPIPITDRIDYRPNWISMSKFIGTTIAMNYFTYKFKKSETERVQQDIRENYHYNIKIPWIQLQELKTRLKKKSCSLTGFIQACLFITLMEQNVLKDIKWNEIGFDISIPNDNRKNLPSELVEEQYKYGSNVGGSHYTFQMSSFQRDQIWELSKYYTQVIQTADYNVGLGTIMLDMVYKRQNVDKIISESYVGNKRGGIILSNIGLHDTNPSEREEEMGNAVGVKDLKFVQDVGALNFALVVNICSVKMESMNICISGIEGTIGTTRDDFNSVFQAFHRLVGQYCEGG